MLYYITIITWRYDNAKRYGTMQNKTSLKKLSFYLVKKFDDDSDYNESDFKLNLMKDFPELHRNFFDVKCKTFDEENFFEGGVL